jgi:hypothetical protein
MSSLVKRNLVLSMGVLFTAGSAEALSFPESCRTPGGVVTEITGLNTEKASMVGQHTLPDIIWSCTQGHVHQGVMETSDCIDAYKEMEAYENNSLFAQANCPKGAVTVNGNLTVFPIFPACAIGGFQAIKAYELLCPNSDLKLRLAD